MLIRKKIKVGSKYIDALTLNLGTKNLIILRGSKGYVMCGYLNLSVARKFKDAAVKITGITNVEEALRTVVRTCTPAARCMGIYKGQPIREVLKVIA